ncbi:hypothetical protein BGW42_003849 [Actinomortierella wolfii]|nr:hypothetical protein BGW42_003849 [Actinomortierella wolfii]
MSKAGICFKVLSVLIFTNISCRVQTIDPPPSAPCHHQQQPGEFATTTGSSAHNEYRQQILRRARRSVIFQALSVGIIPGAVLLALVQLSKVTANSLQASYQVQTVDPSSNTPSYHQQQSGDFVATAGSNAHNDNREQTLRKARRGVIFGALAAGIIPGVALLGLYVYLLLSPYESYGGTVDCNASSTDTNAPRSDTDSTMCALRQMTAIAGFVAVFWLFLDTTLRSIMEWKRWIKWYRRNGGIELGSEQAVEATTQIIQK